MNIILIMLIALMTTFSVAEEGATSPVFCDIDEIDLLVVSLSQSVVTKDDFYKVADELHLTKINGSEWSDYQEYYSFNDRAELQVEYDETGTIMKAQIICYGYELDIGEKMVYTNKDMLDYLVFHQNTRAAKSNNAEKAGDENTYGCWIVNGKKIIIPLLEGNSPYSDGNFKMIISPANMD